MKTTLKITFLVLALGALGLFALPAMAAAPNNDTFPNATLVTVGFSETLDTTEATTDADDAQINATCGAPATDASLWYALDGTDTEVFVDAVFAFNYEGNPDYVPAGLLVATGTQGNLTLVTCGILNAIFYAEAGTTYYILAFDDRANAAVGPIGDLTISFRSEIPPPPTLEFSVDPYGTFNPKTRTVTISGQYTCTEGIAVNVYTEMSQRSGRNYVWGSGWLSDVDNCDGEAHPWSVKIFPQNGGVFRGGKALTVTFAITYHAWDNNYLFMEQEVKLRNRRR